MSSSRVQISFDRAADGLRDLDRLGELVIDRAPAEAAAEKGVVNEDRLCGSTPPALAASAIADFGRLRAHPDVDAVGPPMRGRVQRLHRRMREIGDLVDRLDAPGGRGEGRGGVAVAAAVGERTVERGAIFGAELRAVGRGGRAEIPFDRHGGERLLGAPEIVGGDRDAVRHRHGGDHAAPAGDLGEVVGLELAAEHRAIGDGRIDHAGQRARRCRTAPRR